jgi:hypothetical protein
MKKTIFKLILITLFLATSGAVQARADFGGPGQPQSLNGVAPQFGGGDPPFCYPGEPRCPGN